MEKQTIGFELKKIIFSNPENGYSVIVCKTTEGETVTISGTNLPSEEKIQIAATGRWKEYNGKDTFSVESYEILLPTSGEGVVAYLSSSYVYGIGKTIAQRIYDRFGANTFSVMDENFDALLEIKGIREGKKFQKMKQNWMEQRASQSIFRKLAAFGITPAMANRIHKEFGHLTTYILEEDPYRLTEVPGIAFPTADRYALQIGVRYDDDSRIRAAYHYVLLSSQTEGHVCLPVKILQERVAALTQVVASRINFIGNEMALSGELKVSNQFVYLPKMHQMESVIADAIVQHVGSDPMTVIPDLNEKIEEWEKKNGIHLAKRQKAAVEATLQNRLHILTGGPGMGKTTIVKCIVDLLMENVKGYAVSLTATTGCAAKRLASDTKMDARTIQSYTYNFGDEDEQFETDCLICDEFSMADIEETYRILTHLDKNTKLLLVGDVDQLPSVGPGCVLRSIIQSRIVPVTVLDTVFRAGEHSSIVLNARKINKGDKNLLEDDCFKIIETSSPESAADLITQLYEEYEECAVLSPFRKKTAAGSNSLNVELQKRINPISCQDTALTMKNKSFHFYKGDRVMHLKNEGEIINGDSGRVIGVEAENDDHGKRLCCQYDGLLKYYKMDEMENVTLAYATTVHKSQGGEYPVVIIPMLPAFNIMLKRNLFYTAVTRAKKEVVIVGDRRAIEKAIRDNSVSQRYSLLAERIRKAAKKAPESSIREFIVRESSVKNSLKKQAEKKAAEEAAKEKAMEQENGYVQLSFF